MSTHSFMGQTVCMCEAAVSLITEQQSPFPPSLLSLVCYLPRSLNLVCSFPTQWPAAVKDPPPPLLFSFCLLLISFLSAFSFFLLLPLFHLVFLCSCSSPPSLYTLSSLPPIHFSFYSPVYYPLSFLPSFTGWMKLSRISWIVGYSSLYIFYILFCNGYLIWDFVTFVEHKTQKMFKY